MHRWKYMHYTQLYKWLTTLVPLHSGSCKNLKCKVHSDSHIDQWNTRQEGGGPPPN